MMEKNGTGEQKNITGTKYADVARKGAVAAH
jgi:hypothetical protein